MTPKQKCMATAKGKAARKRYKASDNGKAAAKRYTKSAKGKEYLRRYEATPNRRAQQRRHKIEKHRRLRAMLHALKSVPCMDCGGVFDPVCMDFDHRPSEVKRFGVGSAIGTVPLEEIHAEIAKCDVVCANCHRLRTHRYRGHSGVRNAVAPVPTPQLTLFEGAPIK